MAVKVRQGILKDRVRHDRHVLLMRTIGILFLCGRPQSRTRVFIEGQALAEIQTGPKGLRSERRRGKIMY